MPRAARRIGLLAMAVSVIAMATAARADETLKLAVDRRGNWDTAVAEIGTRGGIFKKHGLSLDITYTAGPGETLRTVISGAGDIGVGVQTVSVMSHFAVRGAPVRVIGSARVRSNDYYWYVKADSPMQSIKEATDNTTIAFTGTYSLTHTLVLGFNKVYGLKAQPTNNTNGERSVLTAVMRGRVDVGWAAPPFGLKEFSEGKIRIVAHGSDVLPTPDQTESTVIANAGKLAKDRPVIERFVKAYTEALDYMYASPEALKHYKDFSGIDEAFARKIMAQFYPRAALDPFRVEGLDGVMARAVSHRFLKEPLGKEQLAELFQVPRK